MYNQNDFTKMKNNKVPIEAHDLLYTWKKWLKWIQIVPLKVNSSFKFTVYK